MIKLVIKRRNIRQLFLLYICIVLYLVFLTPNRYRGTDYKAILVPVFHTIERFDKPAGEPFWKYYFEYWANIFGNILLFVPFGVFVSYLYPQKGKFQIIFYGLISTMCIEVTQLILKIGVCDIDDVILNVLGVVCGLYLTRYTHVLKVVLREI